MSYRWCPQGGVGTRRWSKFAKYLSRQGVITDVVCADYPYTDRVNWCADVTGNDRINRHPTPSGYPAYLRQPRRNFWVKAGSRLLSATTHRTDTAQGWGRYFRRRCEALLQAGVTYDAVILTVPSFSSLAAFSQLAASYPGVPFIVDYRDPWTYFLPDYGRTDSPQRRRFTAVESNALQHMRQVWMTTEEHRRAYALRFPDLRDKFRVLKNGYDPEEFSQALRSTPGRDNLVAICPGTLIRERLETLLTLVRTLTKVNDPVLNADFRISLYTSEPPDPAGFDVVTRQAFDHFVQVNRTVPPGEMAEILARSRYGLVLHDVNYTQTVPIKLYDFLAAGCEVIYLGPETEVSRKLAAAGHYCAADDESAMLPLLRRLSARQEEPPAETDFPEFAIPVLTERLLRLIGSVRK